MTKFVQDILSARRKVDELFREAALVLNAACSSEVERIMEETKGD